LTPSSPALLKGNVLCPGASFASPDFTSTAICQEIAI
jgi:hypothetical protein